MFNKSGKTKNYVNIANNYKNTSVNVNYNSQNRKNSIENPVSSELYIYLKTKEKNGISLYTHIQALLDIFIFQNPIQPVKYFEYYSEKLKETYHKLQLDSDVDFLNNIQYEINQKISNIYKDSRIKNVENQNVQEKTSFLSNVDEISRYEGENEFEEDIYYTAKSNEVIVQDITKINYMFNKAGCGLTNDEANLIGITMNEISHLEKFKNIRYWGKILGLKHNYYILECEWKDKELEYKLRILNHMMSNKVSDNNKDIYENEEQVEYDDSLFMGYHEHVEENESLFSSPQIVNNKYFNNKSEHEFIDSQKSNPLCSVSPTEIGTDDHLSNEMFGFGVNKKSYFVTNKLYNEWIELPLLKSHHVIQARNIKRYFIGDLESHVESYPSFQGLEKHYLRAQIARITAATQISPCNYFILDTNNTSPTKWRKLSSFQSKVMSKKWIHDYTENQNFISPSIYALLEPINWVHHVPMISDQGVTLAWTKILNEDENKISSDNIQAPIAEDSESLKLGQDWFTALSEDTYVGLLTPWKCEMTNPFDHEASYVTIRSHIWPGAFAVTRDNILDYTYNGWGLKWNVIDYTPQMPNEYKFEHLKDTEETTEIADPTHADEQSFFSHVQRLKELKKNIKMGLKPFTMFYGDEDDEEKIINNYDYN